MPFERQREINLCLCESALLVWEKEFPSDGLEYKESVCGTIQRLEAKLPSKAIASVRSMNDVGGVEESYNESVAALQDEDFDLSEKLEFAFYAIYNAFNLYICKKAIDPWLIANQALSAIDANNPDKVLKKVMCSI